MIRKGKGEDKKEREKEKKRKKRRRKGVRGRIQNNLCDKERKEERTKKKTEAGEGVCVCAGGVWGGLCVVLTFSFCFWLNISPLDGLCICAPSDMV